MALFVIPACLCVARRQADAGVFTCEALAKPCSAGLAGQATSSELELVPDFRRDDVWTPAFAPGHRHSGAGLVTIGAASRGELTLRD